jgi:hypothetical protein
MHMTEKFSLYEVLSNLVPGTLLVGCLSVLFPSWGASVATGLPNEFVVVLLLAASVVAGMLVQTLGSLGEPVLFRAFGGRPSDLALAGRLNDRYLGKDKVDRLLAQLRARFGSEASHRSLFLGAMAEAEATETSRAKSFNAHYGYLRSITFLLLLVMPLVIWSRFSGRVAGWPGTSFWAIIVFLLAFLALFSWRAWQRGAYYAREVLLAFERLSNSRTESQVHPPAATNKPRC